MVTITFAFIPDRENQEPAILTGLFD